MTTATRARIFSWLCFTLGGAALVVGAGWGSSSARLVAGATTVDGRITGYREIVQDRRNHTVKHPLAEYEVGGKIYQAESPAHTEPPRFKTGDAVKILVPPGDPAGGKFGGFVDLWLGPLVLAVLGTILCGVGWWGRSRRIGGASRSVF
ncbi:hypothetical protein llg_17110 [Luteolibacter sp. LG18]|nr:hypothetical protein llg_17110 [Luteolibacter sp. LG18]